MQQPVWHVVWPITASHVPPTGTNPLKACRVLARLPQTQRERRGWTLGGKAGPVVLSPEKYKQLQVRTFITRGDIFTA